jgi:hypothetical protein
MLSIMLSKGIWLQVNKTNQLKIKARFNINNLNMANQLIKISFNQPDNE